MAVVVPSEGIFKLLAHCRIEPLEGKPRRGKFGFAAVVRNDARRKNRRQRRHALERTVGVPELIGLVAHRIAMIRRYDFAVRADRSEDDEMRSGAKRTDLGYFRWTEAARKCELALVGHVLIAEHQDRIVFEYRAHRPISRIMCGDVGERHAAQFGTESGTQRDDVHRRSLRCVRFGKSPPKCPLWQGSLLARKYCALRQSTRVAPGSPAH